MRDLPKLIQPNTIRAAGQHTVVLLMQYANIVPVSHYDNSILWFALLEYICLRRALGGAKDLTLFAHGVGPILAYMVAGHARSVQLYLSD